MNYVTNNPALKNAIDMIQYGVNGKDFSEITSSLINVDPYMALADFADYQTPSGVRHRCMLTRPPLPR